MARSRNIKPNFFLNEDLAACNPLARLLFAGLWGVADREGRLEDRPKRLKAAILPYDDCDPGSLLDELAARGFIHRYQVDERRFITIPTFGKHQNPHCKEADSSIPAPDSHRAGVVKASEKHQPCPADSLNPITDSLSPDSLTPSVPAQTSARDGGGKGKFEENGGKRLRSPNPVAPFAVALNKAGFRCTAMNPGLIAFVDEGGQVSHLLDCASQPSCKGKGAGYVIAFARREQAEAAQPVTTSSASDSRKPLSAVDRVLANIQSSRERDHQGLTLEGKGTWLVSAEVSDG